MDPWPGGEEATRRIFRFFDIEYTKSEQNQDGLIVLEGVKWGKRLLLGYNPGDKGFLFIQFRTNASYRSQGGVIIFKCQGIEMAETPFYSERSGRRGKSRYVSIWSINSMVTLDKFGVYAEIENAK